MHTSLKATLLISSALISTSALAQSPLSAPPPTEYVVDERGVDLISGTFNLASADVVIGQPGQGGLTYERTFAGTGWRDNTTGTLQSTTTTNYVASFGGYSEAFTLSGTTFTPIIPNGSTLVKSGDFYIWTLRDGTKLTFNVDLAGGDWTTGGIYNRFSANRGRIVTLETPQGETRTFHYEIAEPPDGPTSPPLPSTMIRLVSVTNNYGYQIRLKYEFSPAPFSWQQLERWLRVWQVTGVNNAVDYCDPTAQTCTLTRTWPKATYDQTTTTGSVTDQSSRVTNYTYSNGLMTGVKLPGSTSNDLTIDYSSSRVSAVAVGGNTWSYAYSDASGMRTTTITDPASQEWRATGSIADHTLSTWRNPLLQTISYVYSSERLSEVTLPDGQSRSYTYDGRGNVTQATVTPVPGSGLSPIVTSAAYPSTCSNPLTCNQPTSITDARGAVTDYTYDSGHGGVLTVTAPAPASGADRPQTRITYGTRNAWYKNASGTIVEDADSVHLPTEISACASGSSPSCVGTANESRTTITYGSTGVANNLLPTVVTNRDGTGSLSASTSLAYTADGDVASVDGPLAGTTDTTTYRYDTARQRVGTIGPDPDGAGSLLRRAQRVTYNSRGAVTLAEAGTVTGLSDPNWAAFNSLQHVAVAYDSYGRPTHQRVQSGGATHNLVQISYDPLGRTDCVTIRMNPATFASPPASACTLSTTGGYGPDRATKYDYDAANRPTSTTSGYASGSTITESATWSVNGQPVTMTDGNGNVSALVYDGFGRLSRLRYPNASGGGTSTTDYQEYGYDAASNITSYRNRGGDTFALTYDNLNRTTLLDAPSGTNDTSVTYDLLNRALTTVAGGQTLTDVWDALGRRTSETGPVGTVAYEYDLASRRTRITWPDTLYVEYDYDLANDLTAVRENGVITGAGVLATYAYDNLGRRTSAILGNGAASSWSFDGASRLTNLTHNLSGTASDLTLSFTYSPANQIVTRTLSNPSVYAYVPALGATGYDNNGRNQVTSAGGSTISYDSRLNITTAPTGTYGYNALDQLTSANPGTAATLSYDPAGRLYQTAGTSTTRFLYSGAQAIGEYNSFGTLLRRYVPGAGLDQTVAAYEGAGTTDRRWLMADERESVVAIANSSAAALSTNTYDEYGVPGSGNSGRFQYTGQMWLPEAQIYHYRARAYAPTLGRFMQTDPIGYQAGANLYAYVGVDPVNRVDPFGLQDEPASEIDEVVITGTRPIRLNFVSPASRLPHADGGGVVDVFFELDEVVVTASEPHHLFTVVDFAFCSPEALFATFRKAGRSAPDSPYARAGTRQGISLLGSNPITQIVSPSTLTITNITEEGHMYYKGTVTIRISDSFVGSRVDITGRGTNTSWPVAIENEIFGAAFFTYISAVNTIECTLQGG